MFTLLRARKAFLTRLACPYFLQPSLHSPSPALVTPRPSQMCVPIVQTVEAGDAAGRRHLTVSTFNILCPLFRRVHLNQTAGANETAAPPVNLTAASDAASKEGHIISQTPAEAAGSRQGAGGGGEGKNAEGKVGAAKGEAMGRESAYPEMYEERQEKILELLLQLDSDVVCLQVCVSGSWSCFLPCPNPKP